MNQVWLLRSFGCAQPQDDREKARTYQARRLLYTACLALSSRPAMRVCAAKSRLIPSMYALMLASMTSVLAPLPFALAPPIDRVTLA